WAMVGTAVRRVTTLPSIPTSPISFMMTATGLPRSPCSSTWRRSVVFPLPRNPVRMSTATLRMSADRQAGEPVRHGLPEEAEQRRGDVVDREVGEPPAQRRLGARGREDEDPVPVVVRLVRTGIVLEGVDAPHPDGAAGARVETAEVDDQVGCPAVYGPIELLRPVRPRADVPAGRVGDRLDAGHEVRPHALVVGGIHRAGRFAAPDVHEEP